MSKFDKLAVTLLEGYAPEGSRAKATYEVGDKVKGPFGKALIIKFNNETGDCILRQLEYWDEEIKPGYEFRSSGFELFGHIFENLNEDASPLIWIVSQTYLPDTVVEIVKLEHERKAKRFSTMEEAMRHLLTGQVIVIPDPVDPKFLKIHFANWDSS